MKAFFITNEMMKKAKTYMPLSEKEDLAKQIAELCLVPLKVTEEEKKDSRLPISLLYGEDMANKSILVMNTLLGFYFDIDVEDGEDPYKIYDHYAEHHILNQLERFKSDAELKNKAFDILSDFKEFKKMVDTEIFNLRTLKNDPLHRLSDVLVMLTVIANSKKFSEKLKEITKEEAANDG